MDLLAALHSFVRVAATGSFSAVSRETGLSQPTISRHIALLETHYGATLFARTTRSLMMTEDGRMLLPHVSEILAALETAETVIGRRRSSVSGLVRLGVTTAFGLCLTTRLGSLLAQHPDLSVELVMRDSFGDIVEEGLDLAIRVGEIAEGSLITRRLGEVRRWLVVSSEFPEKAAAITHPKDLTKVGCVVFTYGGIWHDWSFSCGEEKSVVTPKPVFRVNSSEAAMTAICSGVGAGILPVFQVRKEVEKGRLTRLLPEWEIPSSPLSVVHTGPRTVPLRTRTVLDFLIEISSSVLNDP